MNETRKGWTERHPSLMAVAIAVLTLVGGAFLQRHDEQEMAQVQRERLAAALIAEACAIGRQAGGDLASIAGGLSRHHALGIALPSEDIIFQHNLDKIGDLSVTDIDLLYRIHTDDLALRDLQIIAGVDARSSQFSVQDLSVVSRFVDELRRLDVTAKATAAQLQREYPGAGKCVLSTSHGIDWMNPPPELVMGDQPPSSTSSPLPSAP